MSKPLITANNRISARQLCNLLVLDIFGTSVINLPRLAAEQAGQDAWVCLIPAAVAALICTFIITTLAARFSEDNFVEYSRKILTRPLGTLVALLLILRLVLNCALQLRLFGEIVRETMLPRTPFSVVCAVMLLLGAYAASKGFETRARVGEILIFIALLPLLLVLAIAIGGVDFSNLQPVLTATPIQLVNGSYRSFFAFNGIELLLLVFPYLGKPKQGRRSALSAVTVIALLFMATTVVAIAKFGAFGVQQRLWPVLDMMDTVNLPGSLIERQEALVMSFWIVSIFATTNAAIFFSTQTLKDVVGRGQHLWYIVALVPLIFLAAHLPKDLDAALNMVNLLNDTLGIAFMLAIPLLMLLVAKIRRLRHDE